jgi:hypothetical protein
MFKPLYMVLRHNYPERDDYPRGKLLELLGACTESASTEDLSLSGRAPVTAPVQNSSQGAGKTRDELARAAGVSRTLWNPIPPRGGPATR